MMEKELSVRFEKSGDPEMIDVLFRASERDEQVEALMKCVSEHIIRRLTVTDDAGRNSVIEEKEIVSASSEGRRVRIITKEGSYSSGQTLQGLEKLISRKQFMRISRYELVNVSKIRAYDFTIRGTLRIELEGGIETWASRRYISQIKKHLLGKEEEEE